MTLTRKTKFPGAIMHKWHELTEIIAQADGILFVRNTSSDMPVEISTNSYEGRLELTDQELAKTQDFLNTCSDNGAFATSDAITVTTKALIGTSTVNCLEVDTEIHRQIDTPGPLVESGDTIISLAPIGDPEYLFLPQTDLSWYQRDAVSVVLHTIDIEPQDLDYAGSFDISQKDATEICSIELSDPEEDDLDTAKLVCDMHTGKNGLRSLTITRDTLTIDGAVRRVVFSDLHI